MAIQQTALDYILNILWQQLFGVKGLLVIGIMIFAIVIALTNNLDFSSMLIIFVPLILGLIGASFMPTIFLFLIVLFASFLWINVAFKLLAIIK